MVHAQRGLGKTFFALSIALAVASGMSLFDWKVGRARKVLYIDGEMSATMMQERLSKLLSGLELQELSSDRLHIMTLDDQADLPGGLNLANAHHRKALETHLHETSLIILDNLSCLYRNGDENAADSWDVMNDWLLQQRRTGRSVLLIHHSGKGGQQRGTSRREDILDTVIALKPAKNNQPNQGARFKIKFEKSRSFTGTEAASLEVVLAESKGSLIWEFRQRAKSTYAQVVELFKGGMSQSEIAMQLHKDKGTISRHVKTAKENGDV
jgi:predicted ATP-dependent serine protease